MFCRMPTKSKLWAWIFSHSHRLYVCQFFSNIFFRLTWLKRLKHISNRPAAKFNVRKRHSKRTVHKSDTWKPYRNWPNNGMLNNTNDMCRVKHVIDRKIIIRSSFLQWTWKRISIDIENINGNILVIHIEVTHWLIDRIWCHVTFILKCITAENIFLSNSAIRIKQSNIIRCIIASLAQYQNELQPSHNILIALD